MNFEIINDNGYKYVEKGEGEVLLLLHGLFGALSNWETVTEHFSRHYKVVIPLMPIYDLPVLSTNVDSLAKFIHKFIEYKQYDKVSLLGNSLGGHVALVYALDHPEKIYSLILTGSSGLYEDSMGGSFPKRESYSYIKERVEYTFYKPETATKELVDEVYEIVNNRNKALRILSMAKSAMRHNLKEELGNITVPVLLIWGKNDRITPSEVGEEFHKLMPNSEIYWIDECGHAPMMEQPAEFNAILDKFLKKIF